MFVYVVSSSIKLKNANGYSIILLQHYEYYAVDCRFVQ